MDKVNKPQWLIDAEKAIQKFEKTDIAKLTDNQMRMKERNSIASSMVSQETRSKAGKIAGQKNVESGHWNSLKTPEHQSKAGTISGNNHVESGHWRTVIELGAKACSDKFKAIRLEKTTTLRALMQDDVKYTRKELETLGKSAGLKNFIRTITNDEFPELITKIKGPKKSSPSYYVKTK